ncbi:WhiB family transcriptional regulator [Streptomyces sp. A73]|uniref:WhiB family transcriptional regulator n=1 Tax=Streptomyces smyrnaeus TaxID=1387713 RepID=UPI001B7149ED|nr:WhiB family transcriptional regulator [Streptomyces sp. A73]
MAFRPVRHASYLAIRGTSRPHLRSAKRRDQRPKGRSGGGAPIPGVDPTVEAAAACKDTSTDLFFSDGREEIAVAKEICGSCPVRVRCLDRALANGERFGIFGGLTPDERSELTSKADSEQKGAAA